MVQSRSSLERYGGVNTSQDEPRQIRGVGKGARFSPAGPDLGPAAPSVDQSDQISRVASDGDFDICLQMPGHSIQGLLHRTGGVGLQLLDAVDHGNGIAPGFTAPVEFGDRSQIPLQIRGKECGEPPGRRARLGQVGCAAASNSPSR